MKRWFDEEEKPSLTAAYESLRSLTETLEQSLGGNLDAALARKEEVEQTTSAEVEHWRKEAEKRLSPQIRAELEARRAASELEFQRLQSEVEERLPEDRKRRILRLKQEQLARRTEAIRRRAHEN